MTNLKVEGWNAILGGAGTGKTTAAREVGASFGIPVYSADYRFIGNSEYRRSLLSAKKNRELASFTDVANQSSWWDWNQITEDLMRMKRASDTYHEDVVYDRDSGCNVSYKIEYAPSLLFEGVMLLESLWGFFDHITFCYTSPEVRLARLIEKDKGRRSVVESVARFLMCDYSERIFYNMLFDRLDGTGKLSYIDLASNTAIPRPIFKGYSYIPFEI